MKAYSTGCVLIIVILSLTNPALGRKAPSIRWGCQFPGSSLFSTMTADSNDSIYVVMHESSQDDSGTEFKNHHLIKYSPDGKQLWRKHVGTREAQQAKRLHVDGLAADDYGNIYAFGTTNCQLGQTIAGGFDAFVIKYDSGGNQQQVWQLGTPQNDRCHGLAVDGDQNLYLVGATTGSFAKTNQGHSDIIIAAYDKQGTALWKDQIGSKAEDFGGGDPANLYCVHCSNPEGSLKSQAEVFEGMVNFMMTSQKMDRGTAEGAAREYMSKMPAWGGSICKDTGGHI